MSEPTRSEQPGMAPMVMMATQHYAAYRWVQAPIAALALWLGTSPFALGYQGAARVNDVVCALVLLVMAGLALGKRRGLVSWSMAFVGLWLAMAPIVFWAPDAAAYLNDTLVGALVIGFGFIIPMGMTMKGATVPSGWSYNPSSWPQRAPIIALSFTAFLAARYMATYQLGYHTSAWDPFFAHGAQRVLTSKVSRAWPVSDAGLGAVLYLVETLMGLMGDERRWRTMPWMVAGFGVIVVPLGIVSITLVVLQPVAVGAWCSLCLFTAAAMLIMIPLSLDEVVAMLQFVARRKRAGDSAWRVFWLGGDEEQPEEAKAAAPGWRPHAMWRGCTAGWSLVGLIALGVWMMAAPAALGVPGQSAAADSAELVGAMIVVLAVIATAEVTRPVRFAVVPFGLWLAIASWFLPGTREAASWNAAIVGLAVMALGLAGRGRLREHYGSFDRFARLGLHLLRGRKPGHAAEHG